MGWHCQTRWQELPQGARRHAALRRPTCGPLSVAAAATTAASSASAAAFSAAAAAAGAAAHLCPAPPGQLSQQPLPQHTVFAHPPAQPTQGSRSRKEIHVHVLSAPGEHTSALQGELYQWILPVCCLYCQCTAGVTRLEFLGRTAHSPRGPGLQHQESAVASAGPRFAGLMISRGTSTCCWYKRRERH